MLKEIFNYSFAEKPSFLHCFTHKNSAGRDNCYFPVTITEQPPRLLTEVTPYSQGCSQGALQLTSARECPGRGRSAPLLMTSGLNWSMGDMLRGLPASHTQPLVFENVSPPEISSLRLSRQAEETGKGLLLNYHFWTCCQPAPPPVTGFDGSSNSTARIRGKTIQSFGWRGLESGREKGEARMQSKLWGSNIIALSEVGLKKKKKKRTWLVYRLAWQRM